MTHILTSGIELPASDAIRPPPAQENRVRALTGALFGSTFSTLITLIGGALLLVFAWFALKWAIVDAVWTAPGGSAACAKPGAGACWAVIGAKYPVILFGAFPYAEQWRGVVLIALWLVWAGVSIFRRVPALTKIIGWIAIFIVSIILMRGGIFGMTYVGTDQWGGLPLSFMIFGGTIAGGLPLGILLALGRRSRLPIFSALCTAVIEVTRGFPLLVVLFFAALIMPLFLPPQLNVDKLVRAEIGMIIFFAAYAAETIRGGLQTLPLGQDEAAQALGLSYRQRLLKVILPQAIASALPSLFNDIVRSFKNTTFFAILGLWDILGATKSALQDPEWVKYSIEGYLFVFLLYFVICSGLSLYGRSLERESLSRLRRAGK
ncbi:amino acid ABC transporter permease [Paenirhodobacter populi]|uniref:Amino acid ABC transporter permease n=1 Tax=Paenirhodobacter populi TaxID=2306993 RepID=A0A443JKB2_9RHOB|nr:amino acid ABC transporter permease [Sinirhodobacter populi]RWR20426.1 amino acid ABC transporter permease [Sinirhodobacter populi]